MAREYFCAYHSYLKSMRNLSDAECGRLFRALLQYSAGDTSINLQGRESIAFDFISEQIDRDNAAYNAKCEANRRNGSLANGSERPRTVANGSERPRTVANGSERPRTPPKEKEKEKEKENLYPPLTPPEGGREKRSRFVPPSVEEVRAYCVERRNGIDPEVFVDFYASKGWKVGKNPMADWKACVRTWERKRKAEAQNTEPGGETWGNSPGWM